MALHIPENTHWNILVFHENSGVIPSAILPLSMEGYSIRSFKDTESAIKAALEETPDVILICADARDNGWAEPCAVFRKHESLRDIPIILLESTLPADRRKVFAAGCLDCIPYPHEPMELMTKLEALMKLRRMKSSDALMEENGRLRMELAEKRKEEEELIRKNERFNQAIRLSRIGIFEHDHKTDILFASPEYREMWGFSPGETVTLQKLAAQYLPEERDYVMQRIKKAHTWPGDGVYDIERRIIHRDGTIRWQVIRSQTFFDGEGPERKAIRTVGAALDITAEKTAAETRKSLEERIRQVVRISGIGIFDDNHSGEKPYFSPEYREIWGWEPDSSPSFNEMIQRIHPDDRQRVLDAIEKAHDPSGSGFMELEHRIVSPEGGEKWLSVKSRSFFEGQGPERRLVRTVGAAMDITEGKQASIARKKLEDDLYQSQKLNSIGQLAGGVAHDFNNLLVPIIGYAEICQKALSRDSPLQGHLEKIKTAAGRAASLTKQLLAFSRQQRLDVSTLDLNIIARDFQDILRRLIPENIQMDVITCESPCHIKADRTQIEQILMNLSVNARDAMPDGGRLLIETSRVRLDELQTKIHPEITPGRYVMLAMTDTGHGIDPETQKRIFEPFFTTKEQGKGTGLGLATVFGIVKQHGGYIWVYSEKGKGATFKVYLPEAVGRARETETAAAETESAYGNETILLVEDDEMVRALTMKTLSGYGYRVLEAESPERALELAAEQGNGIDMLLTDVIMPGMNGRELYDRLSGIYPGLRVLYMSGYTGNIIFDHGISDEEINFLEKPFTATGLGAKIRAVLDKKSS